MTVIYKEHVAHVRHACAWDCGYPIRIGERYVMSSVTPNDPEIGNLAWWHHALHGRSRYDCPDYKARESGSE